MDLSDSVFLRRSSPGRRVPFRALRARRIRRAFDRHPREQAIPISGVTVPGIPPLWTWVYPFGSGRLGNLLRKAFTRNVGRTSHASQMAVHS
jgi:hypothetical protein